MNRGAQESQFKKSSLESQAEIQEEEFLATRAEQAIVAPPPTWGVLDTCPHTPDGQPSGGTC